MEILQSSKHIVGIKSGLPGNIMSTTVNAVTRRRVVLCPETGFSPSHSRSNKICQACGKSKRGRGTVCRVCYQKVRKVAIVLKCALCGKIFEKPRYEYEKALKKGCVDFYCGLECSRKHHAVKHSRHCPVCDESMKNKSAKFCSPECRKKAQAAVRRMVPCLRCQKMFHPVSSRSQFCSMVCKNAAHSDMMKGVGNSHYKDGTSYSKLFREMRKLILERDDDVCVACTKPNFLKPTGRFPGALRMDLLIHHIDSNPRNNDPTNLVVLCSTCHARHTGSSETLFPWFADYALEKSRFMTSRWKERVTFLLTAYSSAIAS